MKAKLLWSIVAAVAVWQVELAVRAGVAASRRPRRGASVVDITPTPAPSRTVSPPKCQGPSCPTPSQHLPPQRVIVR